MKSLRHELLLILFETHIWQILNEKKLLSLQEMKTSAARTPHLNDQVNAHNQTHQRSSLRYNHTIADISYLFRFIVHIAFGDIFPTNGIVIGVIHVSAIDVH